MSWMPTNDPVLGDPKSCDALELVIVPRTRDLGDGFEVRRALPHGKRQMVGPFIFFDHFGPVQFVSGKGMDVRPHPHIGLATVTYLFDGSVMHRDSEGNIQEIEPGAMNLMTAGRGIAHSERTPDVQRKSGQKMLGLQSSIALRPGDRITVKAAKPVRMMFLGGDALEGPRHIWWNFVSASKERIEQAKQDWKTGRFAHVPNETEFIPLPE